MQVKAIKLAVGCCPEVIEIDNSLEAMQALVGGWIEILRLNDGLDLVMNEEGKLLGLPPNVSLFGGLDVVAGDCFLIRHNTAGEAVSVTATDIKKYVGRGKVVSL